MEEVTNVALVTAQEVMDALPGGVVVTDGSGIVLLWSSGATSLFGWTAEQAVGRPITDVVGEDDSGESRRVLEAVLTGHPYEGRRRVRLPDGTEHVVTMAVRSILDEDGAVRAIVGSSIDLAELRRLELQAGTLAEHLRLALDAGGLGTWRWWKETGEVVWDERMEALWGLEPGSFDGSYEAYLSMLHPDDRDRVVANVEAAVASKSAYRFEHKIITPSGEVRWLEGAGNVTLGPGGEVTGTIGCTHDVTDRVAAQALSDQQRAMRDRRVHIDAAMADVARQLSGARTLEEAVGVIIRTAGPLVGSDRAEIGLVRSAEDMTLHAIDDEGTEPSIVTLAALTPLAEACHSEVTVEVDDIPASLARFPDLEGCEFARTVASPLFDDNHHIMGALTFWWTAPGEIDDVERTAIETLSRLCGQTLRRTLGASRVELLAGLASEFARSTTVEDVARVLRAHGQRMGAVHTNLRVFDQDLGGLVEVVDSTLPPELVARYRVVPIGEPMPLAEAARRGTAIWVENLDDLAARYPDIVDDARTAGLGALAAVPLRSSDGSVAAVLALSWPAAMRFDETLRATLLTTADLAGQTVERCHLHEAEHAVVLSLQRRLLAPLPQGAGVEVVARYEPAAGTVGMGGDWYEAFDLDDGSMIAVIGDVVGHGVEAIAAMAQLQHLVTGLVRSGTPPERVLAETSAMLTGPEQIYATAQLVHVTPSRDQVGIQSAGHPWALLRHPDGSVEKLDTKPLSMLGTRLEPRPLDYVDAGPGCIVLMYTDGLIERRRESIDESMQRLAELLAGIDPGSPLDEALDEVIAKAKTHLPDLATNDDIALMALRLQ